MSELTSNWYSGTSLQKAKLADIMVKIIVNYDRFVTILVIEWDQHDTTFQPTKDMYQHRLHLF